MKKFIILFALLAQAAAAQTVPNYVPSNGLVGWWPFNGNASNSLIGGNPGTVLGGVNYTNDRNGNALKSFQIDGQDCPNSRGILLPVTLNSAMDYTISVWWKSNSNIKLHQTLLNSAPHEIIALSFNHSFAPNKVAAFVGNGGWVHLGSSNNWIINSNSWTNTVICKQGSLLNFYSNGNLVHSLSFPNAGGVATGLNFGASSINGGSNCYETFSGSIDDIGIWNRALTLAEIQSLYFACNDTLSQNPSNTTSSIGTTATFTALSPASGATYQWQAKNGSSFVNVSNAGQFSGATSSTLMVSGVSSSNNGLQVRCIVDHGDCVDTSDIAVLTSCFSLTAQPFDQYVVASNSASFSVATNDPACTYQWQTNAGFGFQNLSNAGQFSGVTSATLSVNSVSTANNNQVFRCLVSAGTCKDTTITAKIVLSGVGVSENSLQRVSVSPNPTRGSVDLGVDLEGTYILIGIDGRTAQSGSLRQILDFSNQPAGVYSLRLETSAGSRVVKVVKE